MTVATLRESIQADANIAPISQHIYHNGRLIAEDTKTMEELQIGDGEMLAVHVRPPANIAQHPPQQQQQQRQQPQQQQRAQQGNNDPELLRLRVLGSPTLRQQLQQQHPELSAAVNDPTRFAQILQDGQDRERRETFERHQEIARLNEDPFNIENQRKIEEMIRQERVMENLQNAMEYNPEGRNVTNTSEARLTDNVQCSDEFTCCTWMWR